MNESTSFEDSKVKRSAHRDAWEKYKQAEDGINLLKRRFQVHQVKDDEYRSKTIQHENKIKFYEKVKEEKKKTKLQKNKVIKERNEEVEVVKERNKKQKHELEEKIKYVKEVATKHKNEENKIAKEDHVRNEQMVAEMKVQDYEDRQLRRKQINKEENLQKKRISRYFESKVNQTLEVKLQNSDAILLMAQEKEKQLERMSRMEEEMVKRNSQSVQKSLEMKNRLRSIIGDERRALKLPHVHSRTSSLIREDNKGELLGTSNKTVHMVMV